MFLSIVISLRLMQGFIDVYTFLSLMFPCLAESNLASQTCSPRNNVFVITPGETT